MAIGERVGVPWLGSTCGRCEHCRAGRENLCDAAKFTGYTIDGGYADHVVADARYCFSLPDRDSFPDLSAAPLLCAGITTFKPLRKHVTSTSRVGVIGVGGLGHVGLQFANAFGCEVTAFSTSPDKEADALWKKLRELPQSSHLEWPHLMKEARAIMEAPR